MTHTISPYLASIEYEEGKTFIHEFHFGTDEAVARKWCKELWGRRRSGGLPTITIGLMQDGRLVDTFLEDKWASEYSRKPLTSNKAYPYHDRDLYNAHVSFYYPESEADAPDAQNYTSMQLAHLLGRALVEPDWTSITFIITRSKS